MAFSGRVKLVVVVEDNEDVGEKRGGVAFSAGTRGALLLCGLGV